MNNSRISAKERNLIKGAIRRVFSRSDLRRSVLTSAKVDHINFNRARVKTWYQCSSCNGFFAGYEMNIDHKDPIIPLDKILEQMNWDTIVDRIWCEPNNLQALCLQCHKAKSKLESVERRKNKKGRQNG